MLKRLFALIFLLLLFPTLASADLTVYYLDVQQGDSAIIVCDDEVMIIDGGLPRQSSKIHSFLENNLHVSRVKYIVATHPDNDHIGGLSAVLQMANVECIFSPVKEYDSDPFNDILKFAKEKKVKIRIPYDGDTMSLGGATVTFFNCGRERKKFIRSALDKITSLLKRDEPEEDPLNNDISLVVKIQYGEKILLFTGDIEKEAEKRLLYSGADLKADVLKVSHHGSSTSSTDAFLDHVDPEYAVISCGENRYGHPSSETLSSLQRRNIHLYRTDLQGDIVCVCDGKNITFSTEKTTQSSVYIANH